MCDVLIGGGVGGPPAARVGHAPAIVAVALHAHPAVVDGPPSAIFVGRMSALVPAAVGSVHASHQRVVRGFLSRPIVATEGVLEPMVLAAGGGSGTELPRIYAAGREGAGHGDADDGFEHGHMFFVGLMDKTFDRRVCAGARRPFVE